MAFGARDQAASDIIVLRITADENGLSKVQREITSVAGPFGKRPQTFLLYFIGIRPPVDQCWNDVVTPKYRQTRNAA